MRLMGIAKLENLANCGVNAMAGAVSALLSELAAAKWRHESEFFAQFPMATCSKDVMRIPMGTAHYVELIIKFEAGMVLVASAGATATDRQTGTSGRQVA